jgi:hypothetical protein
MLGNLGECFVWYIIMIKHNNLLPNQDLRFLKDILIEDFAHKALNHQGLLKLNKISHSFRNYKHNELYDSTNDVLIKICALNYHLSNYLIKEKKHLQRAKEYIKVGTGGMAFEYIPSELTFEFEAFLFQTKACFDIFSKSIGNYFGQNPSNTKRLKKVLLQFKSDPLAMKINLILERNKWLNEFEKEKSIRDIIAHYSSLHISGFLVDIRDELDGKKKRRQINKCKIGKKTLARVMDDYYKKILAMVYEIYKLISKNIQSEE